MDEDIQAAIEAAARKADEDPKQLVLRADIQRLASGIADIVETRLCLGAWSDVPSIATRRRLLAAKVSEATRILLEREFLG
jgi:hypothetical protein